MVSRVATALCLVSLSLTNAGNSLAASKLAIKYVLAGQLPALAEVFASADRNLSGYTV